jgi:hypothetical protein
MASEWSPIAALDKAALCRVSACELTANPANRLATNAHPTTLRSFIIFRPLWVFQGSSFRRAPLASGDPFMSRKTVEKWVKVFCERRSMTAGAMDAMRWLGNLELLILYLQAIGPARSGSAFMSNWH